jgi:peptidyl-prolyl cis-trans isomerase C
VTAVAQGPQVRPPTDADVKTIQALLAELDRDPDTVLADIGPRSLTRADVAAVIRGMPPYLASLPTMEVYQQAVGLAMGQKILAVRAAASGVDKLPSVAYRLRNATEDVLADTYLRGALDANITEDVLHKAYDELVAGKPGPDQVEARIIVTDSLDDAEIAISRISAGDSFAAVARSASKDGTAANDGALGYVTADMLSPEIGAVLFSMAVGEMTAHPVQSGDRWFVLKVEGRRTAAAPSFQVARPMLAHDLALAEIPRIKQAMEADAKIVYKGYLLGSAPEQQGK